MVRGLKLALPSAGASNLHVDSGCNLGPRTRHRPFGGADHRHAARLHGIRAATLLTAAITTGLTASQFILVPISSSTTLGAGQPRIVEGQERLLSGAASVIGKGEHGRTENGRYLARTSKEPSFSRVACGALQRCQTRSVVILMPGCRRAGPLASGTRRSRAVRNVPTLRRPAAGLLRSRSRSA